ncbi:response regulator [Thermodesulfobacteriota bacterium]
MNMINIFIFDDHDSVRESYKRWLEMEGFKVIGTEGSVKNCIHIIKESIPDIIMMDIDFPEKEHAGIAATKKIVHEIQNAKVIFVSHYNEPEIIIEALNAGARGYFSKSDELKYLKETVERVYKGNSCFSPSITSKLIEIVKDSKVKSVNIKTTPNLLTEQENLILNYISQGLTNKEIAQYIRSNEKRVKNIVANILIKFEAKNRAHAVSKGIFFGNIDPSQAE